MKEFRVGVFEHPGPRKIYLLAYTVWFSPDWDGCCLHTVTAATGTEAKRLAIAEHRRDHMKASA